MRDTVSEIVSETVSDPCKVGSRVLNNIPQRMKLQG